MEPNNNINIINTGEKPNNQGGSMGPLIGSIVVIVILVIGAVYFWQNKINIEEPADVPPPELSTGNDDYSLEYDIQNTPDVEVDTNF